MSDGDQRMLGSRVLENLLRLAVEVKDGFSHFSAFDFNVSPANALAPACPQSLEGRLLGREAAAEVLELVLAFFAVTNLLRAEDPFFHVVCALQGFCHAANLNDINTDANDHENYVSLSPKMFYQKTRESQSFFVFDELEKIPGFIHAFTSRQTDTDIKDAGGSGEVARGKKGFLETIGLAAEQLVLLNQVHSHRVVTLENYPPRAGEPSRAGTADGAITVGPNQYPVIRTADCVPILAVLPRRRKVCVLHAGWRGTCDRIAARGMAEFLRTAGAPADEVVVALGPCIRKCCYEVGEEVRGRYREAGHDLELVFSRKNLDLVAANRAQLWDGGVRQVLDSGMCTACRTDLFYSYRREGQTGRMWALAGFRGRDEH